MSFSVCSSGPLCGFPRLSVAFLNFACFAVTRLSMALPSLYVPRYGFPGSLPWLAFLWLCRSLCSSLRLCFPGSLPWLAFPWHCRLFMFLATAFPVLCRGSPFYGFAALYVPRYGFPGSLPWLAFLWLCRSLCSSLRLSRFFAMARLGFQVLAALCCNIPEHYILRYGSSLLAFLKLSWLSRASIANCKNTT